MESATSLDAQRCYFLFLPLTVSIQSVPLPAILLPHYQFNYRMRTIQIKKQLNYKGVLLK